MDLNQLYFRHQLLLMRASVAATVDACLKHESHAAGIARSIGAFQDRLGAKAAASWQAEYAR